MTAARWRSAAAIPLTLVLIVALSSAQQDQSSSGDTSDTLSSSPQIFGTAPQQFRVVPLKGFLHPTALAFLPSGDMLATELGGRLRIVHDFGLAPQPISGVPPVLATRFQGLWDVALHPRFGENQLVYFTYSKRNPDEPADLSDPSGAAVLARGRFDGGHALTDVRDIFVSNTWISGATTARIVFDTDGKVFMSIGTPSRDQQRGGPNRVGTAESAQDPASHAGKVLRLNDEGTVPRDSPFVGEPGYEPAIYALGFRNPQGLIIHTPTGELWDVEHGPQGGDEVNIIRPGRNYGWPVVSYGRAYNGSLTQGGSGPELAEPCAPGMEQPFLFWTPVITPSGLALYTGDQFPAWKGSLFVGGLSGSRALHRVVLNNRGYPTRRQTLLTELKQRIREVRQGPDGLLYLLTDHADQTDVDPNGALLRIEPVPDSSAQ